MTWVSSTSRSISRLGILQFVDICAINKVAVAFPSTTCDGLGETMKIGTRITGLASQVCNLSSLVRQTVFRRDSAIYLVIILAGILQPVSIVSATVLRHTTVVAISGDTSPDKTGSIFTPLRPVMQGTIKPVFVSDIREDGFLQGSGIFRAGTDPGSLELLVRSGQALPDANGIFSAINDPDIQVNNLNSIAFYNLIDDSLGGSTDNVAIFLTDGSENGLKIVVRQNQLDPTATARYLTIPNLITLNDAAQISFRSTLDNQLQGIFRANTATDDITQIAIEGQAVPEGSGPFRGFKSQQSMNESGQVAFHADVTIDTVKLSAIYLGDGTSINEIIRKGESTPSGDGKYLLQPTIYVPVNDNGQVAFFSTLSDTTAGVADNEVITVGDGTNTTGLVRKSEFTPGDDGRYLNLDRRIEINNAGQVVFASTITGASDGATKGIFLGSDSGIIQIARVNQAAPGSGLFSDFKRGVSLNDNGEVLFYAEIDLENGGSVNDSQGLFISDGIKITSVAQVGDVIPGTGTITQILAYDDLLSVGGESSPLNDRGQVTYRFTSGGDIGIAVWLPPLFADGFEGLPGEN
jgi:hypothetical protein